MKLLTILLMVSLAFASCKKKETPKESKTERAAIITFVKGADNSIERENTKLIAKPGDFVFAKDILITGAKSSLDLQLAENQVIKIKEKSRLEIRELLAAAQGATNDELNLISGGIYSKIGKMPPGSQFSVRTPTIVAAVRGTEFYVETNERGEGSVAVTGGKVEVESTVTGEKSLLEEGEKAEVKQDGKVEEKPLLAQELNQLKQYSDMKMLDKTEFANISDKLKDVPLLKEKKINLQELQKQFIPQGSIPEKSESPWQQKGQQWQEMKQKGDEIKKSLPTDNLKGDALKKPAEMKVPEASEKVGKEVDKEKIDKKVEETQKELDKLKKKKLF